VSCRQNLFLEVVAGGRLRLNGGPDPTKMPEAWSCALDVADRGGATLEEVAEHLSVTRQFVQHIEKGALLKLRGKPAIQEMHEDLGPTRFRGRIEPERERRGPDADVAPLIVELSRDEVVSLLRAA
jgi:hypothetical protein